MNVTIAYYSHNTFGLGHVSRASKILRLLANYGISCRSTLLTGCRFTHLFDFPETTDFIYLEPLKSVLDAKGRLTYSPVNQSLTKTEALILRRTTITYALEKLLPDILLIDTTVRGVNSELDEGIKLLRARNQTCIVVAVFRDIIDAIPSTVAKWSRRNYFEWLELYYDLIIVCGSKEIFNFASMYGFSQKLSNKTFYVGYLLDDTPDTYVPLFKFDAIISLGGGRDGVTACSFFLAGLSHAANTLGRELDIGVVFGPLAESLPKKKLFPKCRLYKINPRTTELQAMRKQADISLSMFGYNTACEVLAVDTPALVIPREVPEREQIIRAKLLAQFGVINTLSASSAKQGAVGPAIVKLIGDKTQAENRYRLRENLASGNKIGRLFMSEIEKRRKKNVCGDGNRRISS